MTWRSLPQEWRDLRDELPSDCPLCGREGNLFFLAVNDHGQLSGMSANFACGMDIWAGADGGLGIHGYCESTSRMAFNTYRLNRTAARNGGAGLFGVRRSDKK